jgi:hypothetical protein
LIFTAIYPSLLSLL